MYHNEYGYAYFCILQNPSQCQCQDAPKFAGYYATRRAGYAHAPRIYRFDCIYVPMLITTILTTIYAYIGEVLLYRELSVQAYIRY